MFFNIVVPTLRRLSLSVYTSSKPAFVVGAQNLEFLNIKDDSSMCYVLNEKPFLNEAFVELRSRVLKFETNMGKAIRAMELLEGINNTKFLSLSLCTMADLGSTFKDGLPMFHNLICLKLKLGDYLCCKRLPHFLNKLPNLKALSLIVECYAFDHSDKSKEVYVSDGREESDNEDSDGDEQESDNVDSDGDEEESDSVDSDGDEQESDSVESDGDEPEPDSVDCDGDELDSLPSFLLPHLKFIKIDSTIWVDDNMEVAKYLLKNCEALENFLLVSTCEYEKERLREEILKSPKGSKTCRIQFRVGSVGDEQESDSVDSDRG